MKDVQNFTSKQKNKSYQILSAMVKTLSRIFEKMSLLQSNHNDFEIYINPIFDIQKIYIWLSHKIKSHSKVQNTSPLFC